MRQTKTLGFVGRYKLVSLNTTFIKDDSGTHSALQVGFLISGSPGHRTPQLLDWVSLPSFQFSSTESIRDFIKTLQRFPLNTFYLKTFNKYRRKKLYGYVKIVLCYEVVTLDIEDMIKFPNRIETTQFHYSMEDNSFNLLVRSWMFNLDRLSSSLIGFFVFFV